MRALITGAAGFIGSHLSERLLDEGWDVVGVDNLITGRVLNLAACLKSPRFRFIENDAIYPLNISGRVDWVLHFASPASPPKYLDRPIETLRINSEGTYHLLQLASLKNAQFLFASTSEIYGDPLLHPQPETYWGNVNSIGPRSVYDEAKRFGEAITMSFHRSQGLSTRLIRIFNTYGPRMDPYDGRVVSNMIRQALEGEPLTIYGSGNQTRSFQYVDDLVEGIWRLLDVQHHGPVNLGNPEEFTILELAQMVRELTRSNVPFQFEALPEDDPRQRKPDIAVARGLLGWEPRIAVREGLFRTVGHFRTELLGQQPAALSVAGPLSEAKAAT